MSFMRSRIFHTLKRLGLAAIIVLAVLVALPSVGLHAFQINLFPAKPIHPTEDMFFLDAMHGWTTTSEGGLGSIIFATDDGGKTWRKQGTQAEFYSTKLFFLNRLRGWSLAFSRNAGGNGVGRFVTTTRDGGKTWTRLAKVEEDPLGPTGINLTDILFVDEQHGWIVGNDHGARAFLETTDGGVSFSKANIHLHGGWGPLRRILAGPDGSILIVGDHAILASNDQGKIWQLQIDQYWSEGFCSGWLFPGGHWLVVGSGRGALIVSTSDYGSHWSAVTDYWSEFVDQARPQNILYDVSFSDASHGCAVGNLTTLFCTSDGGKTWMEGDVLPAPKPNGKTPFNPGAYKRIVLLPNGMGWVITDGGYVYQTTDGGHTWAELNLVKSAS